MSQSRLALGFNINNLMYCHRYCSLALAKLSFFLFGFSWNLHCWPSMLCSFLDCLRLLLLSLGLLTPFCQAPCIHLLLLGGRVGIFLLSLATWPLLITDQNSFLDFSSCCPLGPQIHRISRKTVLFPFPPAPFASLFLSSGIHPHSTTSIIQP